MSTWTPIWRVTIGGVISTSSTIANLTITSGRTNIYSQPNAGYCQLQLVNFDESNYSWNIGSFLSVETKNSAGTYVAVFGGYITDFAIGVQSTGSITTVTSVQITALGALSRLPKAITNGILSQDTDGDQIQTILNDLLLNNWNEVAPTLTWVGYTATTTWANAENLGLGEIDIPGQYTLENRSSLPTDVYSLVADIANSALGYIYEDSNGAIGYADAIHRSTYLSNNGYIEFSANDALGAGLRTVTRSGDIRNSISINYGNNYGSHATASSSTSQSTYGLQAETINSLIHSGTDAQAIADRYISLRATPKAKFDTITYPLTNPEIDDSDRDNLLGIFMGMPVRIIDLPANIASTNFLGFVEGWTFRAGVNSLSLTFNASPIEYSLIALKWNQVSGSEAWNTLSGTLDWQEATGVIA